MRAIGEMNALSDPGLAGCIDTTRPKSFKTVVVMMW